MLPDLVIFDCDGVLVDSEPPTTDVLVANLARHGLVLTHTEADLMFVGGTMRGVMDEVRQRGVTLPDNWLDEVYDEIHARLRQGVPLIAGAVALMDALDIAGVPYCVGSNGSETKMGITLGPSGLLDRLSGRLYSAHTLGVAKPDPALFLKPAADFGVSPAACVVIDDSPSGCMAGVAAGMRTIGYAETTDPARLRAVGADPVVANMAEAAQTMGLRIG
ncbi:HAD family phosphatase [Oceaniovalibus sp. ACAM 378]|jgi:HAD superfamily hydrolase (TIGR01509 family)|uniref:HAD family hydrolase n=1 Tax=Oceaniovalibus sp. ACAM 378 TaxID=2599923 RepID=UPI0011DB2B25|nr:HAD family phosphatase [Oceaniovalibus sp. ACAM 378]TYB88425.1 HAD family phosphatase [Oceaniovalibus sp. ACAM 378]